MSRSVPERLRRWAAGVGCLWLLGGVVLGLVVLAVFLFAAPLLAGPAEVAEPAPLLTILPFPTETPIPAPTPSLQPSPEPSATSTPPPAAGGLRVGGLVEIEGTEGDGLRLREGPSLSATVRFVALESEVFELQDGPIEADDYTWWFLVNPYDNSQRGWGVSNYLRTTEGS